MKQAEQDQVARARDAVQQAGKRLHGRMAALFTWGIGAPGALLLYWMTDGKSPTRSLAFLLAWGLALAFALRYSIARERRKTRIRLAALSAEQRSELAATFAEFPAIQKPNTFTIDDAMAKMSEAAGAD